MFLGVASGAGIAFVTKVCTMAEYQQGIQLDFESYSVVYALIKTSVFALIMTSVSAYHGYHTEGGALDVARSSTKAVVYSAVIIMITNLVLTQILL